MRSATRFRRSRSVASRRMTSSIGYFDSTAIRSSWRIIFMFAAGINFSLHFYRLAIRVDSSTIRRIRSFVRIRSCLIISVACIVVAVLINFQVLRHEPGGAISSTVSSRPCRSRRRPGFTTAEFSAWPVAFLPVALDLREFHRWLVPGSTAGGIKVIRWLARSTNRACARSCGLSIRAPRSRSSWATRRCQHRVVDAVWGFFSVYIIVYGVLMVLLMMATGLDQVTAFSAVAASLEQPRSRVSATCRPAS